MSNFIGMVFATLKKEGIDTSKMDTSEAIAKYNEIQGNGGGSSAKGEETPKAEKKTETKGKDTATKESNKQDPEIEKLSSETGLGYKDAERMYKEIQEEDEAYKNFLNNKTEENRDDKYTTGNPDNVSMQSTIANIGNDLQNYKGSGSADLVLPGGKFVQIRPQKDGSFLVRTSNGQKYVSSVEDAKQEAITAYGGSSSQPGASTTAEKMSTAMGVSPDEAKAFVSGKGSLTKGSYEGVSNAKSAPTFEYKSNTGYEKVRSQRIQELMSYGYSQEESEQAFEASVDFWQKQLKCDRETAMKIVAKDRG